MLDITILVLDVTEQGADLPPAGALAARLSGRVIVVPVADSANGRRAGADTHVPARLGVEIEALRAAGVDVSLQTGTIPRRGAGAAIAELARTHGASLIVATGGGYRRSMGAPSRSVARELLYTAPCPVVSVPATPPRRVAAA
jgi:nucleotide-binding universal stress UspA family protein